MSDRQPRVSEGLLERFALGELDGEQAASVESRLAADPSLRAQLEAIRQSNQTLLERYPPRLVGRYIEAVAEDSATDSREDSGTLPPAVLDEYAKRLVAVVKSIGLLSLIATAFNAVGPGMFGWKQECAGMGMATHGLVALVSAAFVIAVRREVLDSRRALDVGLIYQFLVALAVSASELALPTDPSRAIKMGPSYVCVLIVLFPLFVPTTMLRATLTALATATAGPLTAFIYFRISEQPLPSMSDLADAYAPSYFTVLLALIPIKILRRMRRQVSRARRMGSYELGEMLGEGGMGEVWRARHKMLRRPAAIKLIRREQLGGRTVADIDTLLKRFEREAQATAQLHSHHTINLFDFGITDQGDFFYVMELLDGFDVETLVKSFGPQPALRTAKILLQACDSLADAHTSGLIHRDIKPANLYVCRYGRELDFVKVLDFGLVKSSGDYQQQDPRLTGANALTGTPAYVAPEIVMGSEGIDGRADLYSLACVGYWLLTGRLVFEGSTPMKMVVAHVHDTPTPPSELSDQAIPPELDELLLSCLAKDPAARPQTADELAAALRDVIPKCEQLCPWSANEWWEQHAPVTRSAAAA